VSSIKTASSGAPAAEAAPALDSASRPHASSGLARIIRRAGTRRAEAAEHCDFCSAGLAERHRHLLDTERNEPMCVCQACSLLFHRDAASAGHYRLVPERRTRLPAVSTKRLGVPVGLAFFVPQESGTVIAHYPSPAGATQWEVDSEAWAAVQAECPAVAELEPGVQALLVNTARDRRQHWLVPIDDCFALVAVVRREWKGLSGGSTVWPQIDAFFEQLTERH
jgi:hypothetical protein